MDRPRTDLIDVVTAPIAVTYRHAWIVPAVTAVAVGSWFAGLAVILAATH